MLGAEMGYTERNGHIRAHIRKTAHMTQPQGIPTAKAQPTITAPPTSRATAGTVSVVLAIVLTALIAVTEAANVGGFTRGPFWAWMWDFGSVIGFVLVLGTLVFGLVGLRRGSSSRLFAAAGTAVAVYYLATRVVGTIVGALVYNLQ